VDERITRRSRRLRPRGQRRPGAQCGAARMIGVRLATAAAGHGPCTISAVDSPSPESQRAPFGDQGARRAAARAGRAFPIPPFPSGMQPGGRPAIAAKELLSPPESASVSTTRPVFAILPDRVVGHEPLLWRECGLGAPTAQTRMWNLHDRLRRAAGGGLYPDLGQCVPLSYDRRPPRCDFVRTRPVTGLSRATGNRAQSQSRVETRRPRDLEREHDHPAAHQAANWSHPRPPSAGSENCALRRTSTSLRGRTGLGKYVRAARSRAPHHRVPIPTGTNAAWKPAL
jgi:hypothetical protein